MNTTSNMKEKRTDHLWLRNSSRYTNEEVWPLAKMAYELGLRIFQRREDPPRIRIDFTNSKHRYCGRHLEPVYVFPKGAKPENARWDPVAGLWTGQEKWKRILCRIGVPAMFPREERYARYKDMPTYTINCHREGIVFIIAHEMAHAFGTPGGKEGEIKAELFACDAVDHYRKNKDGLNEIIHEATAQSLFRSQARREREQEAKARKDSPEIQAEKILEAVSRWEKKRKFAENKVKHYTRMLVRLSRKMEKELSQMNSP